MTDPTLDANSPNDEMEKAITHIVQSAIILRKEITETEAEGESVWFRNMLCGILTSALRDYRSVEIGVNKSHTMAAWGTRNLLELSVITEYVLASRSNAAEIQSDLVLDTKEFYEAISMGTKAIHQQLLHALAEAAAVEQGRLGKVLTEVWQRDSKRGPVTSISDAEVDTIKGFLKELGVKETTKPKRTSEIAKLLGPNSKASFDPVFKICSKLVHPTAFSIAASTVQSSLDEVMPFLKNSAECYLLSIFGRIDDHFKSLGVRLPVAP